jgi:hypothetical protein
MAFGARIDRRRAILGMLAAGGALAAPSRARAVAVPEPEKAYAAFFLGQGGYWFSWGIPYLASQARELGLETDIFGYSDLKPAWKKIAAKKKDGYKIALIGYSLGNTTITYLQKYLEVDLLLAISESSLGRNHPIKKENTRRSVLWYGPDFLSNAGLKDGFDRIYYVDRFHLLIDVDSGVVKGVLDELKDLVTLPPTTLVAQADGIAGSAAGPTAPPAGSEVWQPTSLPITGDVTCRQCWGLEQSLVGPRAFEP